MNTILQKILSEQHLRTIIMWNRLNPVQIIQDIHKQTKKELAPPSLLPCNLQQLIASINQQHKMTVLDLHGDMGFSQLEKALYILRFGDEESLLSGKQTGISLITRDSRHNHKMLSMSKSTERM